ncbi:thiamine phosphate synthase [Bacillus canaveralius]|uniref:Thiamine-phosphate synthase n=1 Tax=Bacillus canaveralius TaxID=1403243 RepID=A0A2N5GN93_9BACI|nr:thiamine phosphate synthase [Bacillus canaveralius]PLR83738.1 thiamine phosphate synthase [Bacillus canaveralius]PLR96424.1 thiamine phosphate synthase [Bacillus canaveralius]
MSRRIADLLNLYLVTTDGLPAEELVGYVEEAVKGGVTLVQLREKNTSGKDFFAKAEQLKLMLEKYQVPLVINDRIDVALAVGAAGIHLGQEDIPADAVRSFIPKEMILGVSVKNVEQALEAEREGADYLGIGAVFATSSKTDAELLTEGALEQIIESVSLPAVAIGGINLENIDQLAGKGLAGVAVISAIHRSANRSEQVKLLKRRFNQ